MVEQWVKDLVIVKTFGGLRFHEAILKKGAEIKRANSRLIWVRMTLVDTKVEVQY